MVTFARCDVNPNQAEGSGEREYCIYDDGDLLRIVDCKTGEPHPDWVEPLDLISSEVAENIDSPQSPSQDLYSPITPFHDDYEIADDE